VSVQPDIMGAAQIENGIHAASGIMQDVALWFRNKGLGMWSAEELVPEKLLAKYDAAEIYVGLTDGEPSLAFVLQWQDRVFWPDDAPGEAGYVHKLAVARKHRGTGLAEYALTWCKSFSLSQGKKWLRLDCDPDRAGLIGLYERCGFRQVGRRMMGVYDTAFYECALTQESGRT
jgi:GNAT superfamily N-acetyltransferase